MALEWFRQGPMSAYEADIVAERYRQAGRDVQVIDWFNPGERIVNVKLPALKRAPRPSRVYQQKIWGVK